MYVLGDFNRGTVNGGTPRQPASIIGDSINLLSQRYWLNQAACNVATCRDGQSTQGLASASRDAQNTWINAAFLGGVDTTPAGFPGAGAYNGGLENYPRFHEDWTGVNLTYQGSFVSLGEPEHVNGNWCGTGTGCNIYNAPNRLWNFDAAFNNAANLPPLTPRVVYVQQVLFTEDFKELPAVSPGFTAETQSRGDLRISASPRRKTPSSLGRPWASRAKAPCNSRSPR
jgi:hypothetical protein